MVLGTSSGAGKSLLTTALCRYYANKGLRVAPFKAQNMSNNARVVASPDGHEGEIGTAQYFQALAARAEPSVLMNPLLLKPERDTHSQVVLMGQVNAELGAMPWRGRSEHVWPAICQALDTLRSQVDVVVIEGAGSPAEINLHSSDIVNMRIARYAQARCLLVTDIDRGGAFAHLFGTWALLPPDEQSLIKGFVLNKFRGDATLLAPGPQMLQDLTGIPTVATLPMWREHGLPDEDGVFDDGTRVTGGGAPKRTIALVAWPRISNLDEFQALRNLPDTRLVWARHPAAIEQADWVILPGSKHTSSDLAWLRHTRIDAAIAQHVAKGKPLLAICGGLQMLGEALIDPFGIDGNAPGLGLLPLVTVFAEQKTVRHTQAHFEALPEPFAQWSGLHVQGYEIHHGQTTPHAALQAAGEHATAVLRNEAGQALGWRNAQGNVMGVYLHGLFENAPLIHALFGANSPSTDSMLDGLGDFARQHFDPTFLDGLLAP
jgi:adenosylcobyric acid synthase